MSDPRLVVFTDRRTGQTFTMTVPATSPWHTLLDPVTEADIRVLSEEEEAERAAYVAAGGCVLQRDLAPRRPR